MNLKAITLTLAFLVPGALNAQPQTRSQTQSLSIQSLSMWVHTYLVYDLSPWQPGGPGTRKEPHAFANVIIQGSSCQKGFSGDTCWPSSPASITLEPQTVTHDAIKALLKVTGREDNPREESREISIPFNRGSTETYTFNIKDYMNHNVQVIIEGEIK